MGIVTYWFSFSGRIGRAQWWLRRIGLVLIMGALGLLGFGAIMALGLDEQSPAGHVLIGVLALIYLPGWLAIQARRWHDLGKSGWWQLAMFIPLVGALYVWIMCGFVRGDEGDNDYGHDPVEKGRVS